MKDRIYDYNKECNVTIINDKLTPDNLDNFKLQNYDYIVDAIDSLDDKCFLLAGAYKRKIKVIAAMGAGCRFDPTQIQYADISKTYGCKLAKNVRSKLKKEYNITKGIMCVFSPEVNPGSIQPGAVGERPMIGSNSFMPGLFGLFMAAKVINDLAK